MQTQPAASSQPLKSSTFRDFLAIAALVLLLAGLALVLTWPWLRDSDPSSAAVRRYLPLESGDAWSDVKLGKDGKPITWVSQTAEVLPALQAYTYRLRKTERDALEKMHPEISEQGRLDGAQVVEIAERALDDRGQVTASRLMQVRDTTGDYLLSSYNQSTGTELVFTPPVRLAAADLGEQSSWRSEGTTSTGFAYAYEVKVAAREPLPDAPADFEDCLRTEARMVLSLNGQPVSDERFREWICAGAGTLVSETVGADGAVLDRSLRLSHSRLPVPLSPERRAALAPTEFSAPAKPAGEGAESAQGFTPASTSGLAWTRFGRTRPRGETSFPGGFAPVYLPAAGDERPLLLAAASTGDLYAFYADAADGEIAWRFHPGGGIHAAPVADEAGRIFFGASDKRLYAIDRRGLFLWAAPAEDNIAAKAVVSGGVVVYAGEDRGIYAVSAAAGEPLWSARADGPVAAGLAEYNGLVLVGTDSGTVQALRIADGSLAWTLETDGPVEAAIVVEGDAAYITSHDGSIYAVNAGDGQEIWTAEVGRVLRTPVLLTPDGVYAVDDDGRLHAFDRATGRRKWMAAGDDYSGPPALLDGKVYAAAQSGAIYEITPNGRRGQAWTASEALRPVDGPTPDFKIGPSFGGGALWQVDDTGVVRRLGPALPSRYALGLRLDWLRTVNMSGALTSPASVTPVMMGEKALLIDDDGGMLWLEPDSGQLSPAGISLPKGFQPMIEPAASGEMLLVPAGPKLFAVDTRQKAVAWEYKGDGPAVQPPRFSEDGGTAYWVTGCTSNPCEQVTVSTLDVASGKLLWKYRYRPAEGAPPFPGGLAASGNTLYSSTPLAALDAASGEIRWQAKTGGRVGAGGPLLDPVSGRLYAAVMNRDGKQGAILALDAASGKVLWDSPLNASAQSAEMLSPFDRIWLAGPRVLVIPLLSGDLLGLSTEDGHLLWRHHPAAPVLGGVTVQGGQAAYLQDDGALVLVDAESGAVSGRLFDLPGENLTADDYAQRPVKIGERWILPGGWLLFGAVEETR